MALINVAKANTTCPICGKPDWCMISDDGKLSLCQRIENNHPNKKGGWWHSLEENIHYDKKVFIKKEQKIKAPTYVLDAIYSKLLSLLPLTKEHIQDLEKRGIDSLESDYFRYSSLQTKGRYQAAKALGDLYGERFLKITPGIYSAKGNYGDFFTIAGGSGLMIPVTNFQKEICGIQIRVDQPTVDTKYIWLSSTEKNHGTSSGTPIHVAIPPEITRNEIWITEGPLKANILAWRRKCIVVAAAGVSNWSDIPEEIQKIRLSYSIEGPCVIAYDADYRDKLEVKDNAVALYETLIHENQTYFAVWDVTEGKGIDDLVVNKGKASIVTMI